MSKRIFADRQTHPSSTQQGRVPNCYYHKLPIIYFCTKKKCTLPLCEECLPIHKKEHIKEKQIAMEGIVEFESARTDCLSAFSQRRNQIQAIQQKFKAKVIAYRNSIIEIVDKVLDKFFEDCLITDGNLEILKEIHERTAEIKGGSLKELIRYYEDIYGPQHFRKLYKMYSGDYLNNFKLELHKQKIEQIVSAGILNLALKTQNTQNRYQNDASNLSLSEYNDQSTPLNFQVHKTDRINLGKHLSTEQQEESEIQSYKLIKSKKQNNPAHINSIASKQNIYTHPNSKIQQPLSSIPSSNASQVSKSKSVKRKGLSLVKSQQTLLIQSQESFKNQEDKSSSPDRRSNWRNFVNMGQQKPQQPTTTQQIIVDRRHQVNSVLNPKQMRELLAKKKSEQKYKIVINRQQGVMPQLSQRT